MNRSATQVSVGPPDPFFNLASDLMCVLDVEGRCIQINSAFEQQLGYSAEEMRDRPLVSLAHPEDQNDHQTQINRLTDRLIAGESNISKIRFAHRYIAKSGVTHWLEWTIATVTNTASQQLCGIAKDTTARRSLATQVDQQIQARSVAEAKTQLYLMATKNMQLGLYIWQLEDSNNPHSLRLISANPAASTATGVAAKTVLNRTILEAFPALAETDLPERYVTIVKTKEPQDFGEITYGDSRVEEGVFTVKGFPLPDNCMGIVFENITERKKAAQILKAQKDSLLATNLMLTHTMQVLEQRNEELDQFAYVTSHDLKSPLRAIANLATWIEEDLGDRIPAENIEQLDLLKSRVHRMEGLINGLLEYSRVGRMHQSSEQVDVEALLEEVIDALPIAGFTIEIAPDMPAFQAKRAPLFQVFENLIDNAIKHHNRKQGTVWVSAEDKTDFYEFTVRDDGPGIAPAFHEKVFTIFQTLQSRDELESTGIGLSLVKKTILAEGGEIRLISEAGKGAAFLFTWPKIPHTTLQYQSPYNP